MEGIVKCCIKIFLPFAAGALAGVALGFGIPLLSQRENVPVRIIRSLHRELSLSGTGRLIVAQGADVAGDARGTAEFLYTPLHESLDAIPGGRYALLVVADRPDDLRWLIAIETGEAVDADALHARFSARFSPAIVRARVIPGRPGVRDVVVDAAGIVVTESAIAGFTVKTTRHVRTGSALISARRGNVFLFGNDDTLLRAALIRRVSGCFIRLCFL